MYEAFFNLRRKPFDLLPNPEFLYPSRTHKKVLAYLDYGVREHAGFILLTGEVGTGKTTLIRQLIQKHLRDVVLARVFNTKVDAVHLLAMINADLGLETTDKDKPTLLRELQDLLIEQYAKRRPVVLIIDEAQNLSVEVLEEVRMLSNLETESHKLLHIILVGQPELRRVLAAPELLQLRQRIQVICKIEPLSEKEIEEYIYYRLEAAGNRNAIELPPECFPIIHTYTRGIPRLINILCDYILLDAFARESHQVTGDAIHEIAYDLNFNDQYWESAPTAATPPASPAPERMRQTRSKAHAFLMNMNNRLQKVEATQNIQAEKIARDVHRELEALSRRMDALGDSLNAMLANIERAAPPEEPDNAPLPEGPDNAPVPAVMALPEADIATDANTDLPPVPEKPEKRRSWMRRLLLGRA